MFLGTNRQQKANTGYLLIWFFDFTRVFEWGKKKTTWKKPCKFAISALPTFVPVKHQPSRTERCLSRDQSLITCSPLVQWTSDFMVCSSQSIMISRGSFLTANCALPSFQSTDRVPCSRMKLLLTFNNVTLCPLSKNKNDSQISLVSWPSYIWNSVFVNKCVRKDTKLSKITGISDSFKSSQILIISFCLFFGHIQPHIGKVEAGEVRCCLESFLYH